MALVQHYPIDHLRPKPSAPVAKTPKATDYEILSVADLRELAEAIGLEVDGTGARGNVLKKDLVEALKRA